MPTKIERLNKETAALQKTYDRLSTQYADKPGMQKYLDDFQNRITANREEVKKALLTGQLDELGYGYKRGQ